MSGSLNGVALLKGAAGAIGSNIGRLILVAIGPLIFSWGFVFMAREMAGDMSLGFDSRLAFDFLHGLALAVLFVLTVQVVRGRPAHFDAQAIFRVAVLIAVFIAGFLAMFIGVKAAVATYGDAGWAFLLAAAIGCLIMGRLILALPLAVSGIWCLIGFDRSWVKLGWTGGVQVMAAMIFAQIVAAVVVVYPLRKLSDMLSADGLSWTALPLHLLSETILTVILAAILTRAVMITQADA